MRLFMLATLSLALGQAVLAANAHRPAARAPVVATARRRRRGHDRPSADSRRWSAIRTPAWRELDDPHQVCDPMQSESEPTQRRKHCRNRCAQQAQHIARGARRLRPGRRCRVGRPSAPVHARGAGLVDCAAEAAVRRLAIVRVARHGAAVFVGRADIRVARADAEAAGRCRVDTANATVSRERADVDSAVVVVACVAASECSDGRCGRGGVALDTLAPAPMAAPTSTIAASGDECRGFPGHEHLLLPSWGGPRGRFRGPAARRVPRRSSIHSCFRNGQLTPSRLVPSRSGAISVHALDVRRRPPPEHHHEIHRTRLRPRPRRRRLLGRRPAQTGRPSTVEVQAAPTTPQRRRRRPGTRLVRALPDAQWRHARRRRRRCPQHRPSGRPQGRRERSRARTDAQAPARQ